MVAAMKKRELREQAYWDAKAIEWRNERIQELEDILREIAVVAHGTTAGQLAERAIARPEER